MRVRVLQAFRDKRGQVIDVGRTLDVPDADVADLLRREWAEPIREMPPAEPEPEPQVGPVLCVVHAAFVRNQFDPSEWTHAPGGLVILWREEAKRLEKSGHVKRLSASDLKAMVDWPKKPRKEEQEQ